MYGKAAVLIVWLFSLVSIAFVGRAPLLQVGSVLLVLLVAIHSAQCFLFYPALRQAAGPLTGHIIKTFLFGYLYIREVRSRAAASAGEQSS